MAKNTQVAPAETPPGATIILPEGFKMEAFGQSYGVDQSTPLPTIVYLLQNGFSQSLTDAGTSAAAAKRKEMIAIANEERGKGNEMSKAQEKEFCATESIRPMVEEAAKAAIEKRMEALRAGTMVAGARGPSGPRKSPFEAFCHGQAMVELQAKAAKIGKPLPKGETLQGLVDTVTARNMASYRAMWEAQSGADDDLTW